MKVGIGSIREIRGGGEREMGTGQKRNELVVKQASGAMHRFKYEIANELNIDTSKIQGGYWGYMISRDTGAIGGNMVRRMIEAAERSLAEQTLADVKAGFQAGLSSNSGGPTSRTLTSPNAMRAQQTLQ